MPQYFMLWVCPKLWSSSAHYTGNFSPKPACGSSSSPQAGPFQTCAKPVLRLVSQLPEHFALLQLTASPETACLMFANFILIHLACHLKAALIITSSKVYSTRSEDCALITKMKTCDYSQSNIKHNIWL